MLSWWHHLERFPRPPKSSQLSTVYLGLVSWIAIVIDALLSKSPLDESMGDVWLSIERLLPGRFFETLRAKHSVDSLEMTNKRRQDDVLVTEVPCKRRK